MLLVLLTVFSFLSAGLTAADPLLVSLPYGTFRGFTVAGSNVTEFRGVPFGHSERFKAPTPPTPFRGVRNATEYGPACPQQAITPFGGVVTPPVYPTISEDCLSLNVLKPRVTSPSMRLPVFVWIHGGGFSVGNSRDDDLHPLLERSIETNQPILVVSINYRLTALGFIGGKEAAAEGISNLGFRDQILALRWIKQHISSFGGDPDRVVLGGVSAGSMSTAYLTLQNKYNSNSLFRGAFMVRLNEQESLHGLTCHIEKLKQSGAAVHLETQSTGQSDYDDFVRKVNCTSSKSNTNTLDCLRRVSFELIMAAINEFPNIGSYQSVNLVWGPHVDGDVVERDAWSSIRRGMYAKIPMMATVCDDEGTLFSLSTVNITTSDQFLDYVQTNFLHNASAAEMTEMARLYPDDPTQGSPFDTGTANVAGPEYKRTAAFMGDMLVSSPRRFLLEHASARQDVWGSLNKMGKTVNGPLGAFHTSDGPIWFTNTTSLNYMGMDALLNFVNRLEPNIGPSSKNTALIWPKWNSVSKEGKSSLLTFGDEGVSITADNFRKEAMDFLNGFREKHDGRI
ncbi:carboxylic ester hydrolase [Favolaschia claudopus]|uniref:Carboxylic ester hydrolase n=1 Tax=Favolaschia claudopus TaxID=2862362 RepID=A0AAW0BEI6_9AGAR